MNVFFGYPGQVWQAGFATISWLTAQLAAAATALASASAASVAYVTMFNAQRAVETWQLLDALQNELILLQQVQALPITISPTALTFLNTRVSAMQNMIAALLAIIPVVDPATATNGLSAGTPAVDYCDVTETWESANYEPYPSGTTAATLGTQAQASATAWGEIAAAVLSYQGVNGATTAYDAANRMAQVSQYAATAIANLSNVGIDGTGTPGASDLTTLWNQMVTIPVLTMLGSILFSSPNTYINQEGGAIRFAFGTFANELALLVLSLRQPVTSNTASATVQGGDSLMDVAARNLGNFEEWSAIAALNGLVPPFTGPQVLGDPSVAGYGTSVLLPSVNGTTYPAGYPTPSYANNFLGVDIYLGPLNNDMLPWGGDFQIIAGYNNLSISCGRRLQTTLGDLLYHTDYGSRIPPQVGSVQTQYEAQIIAVYGESALLSDPRVAAVTDATCTAPKGANSSIQFSGTVQPKGFGATSVDVNETLAPLPGGLATVG